LKEAANIILSIKGLAEERRSQQYNRSQTGHFSVVDYGTMFLNEIKEAQEFVSQTVLITSAR
jgi:hypothetical protein